MLRSLRLLRVMLPNLCDKLSSALTNDGQLQEIRNMCYVAVGVVVDEEGAPCNAALKETVFESAVSAAKPFRKVRQRERHADAVGDALADERELLEGYLENVRLVEVGTFLHEHVVKPSVLLQKRYAAPCYSLSALKEQLETIKGGA